MNTQRTEHEGLAHRGSPSRRSSRLFAVALSTAALARMALSATVVVDDSGSARNGKVGGWSSIVARNGSAAISYYCEEDPLGSNADMYVTRFAWNNGGGWQWTTVDSGGGETCLARGSDGLYQIVYANWGGIGWATGSATTWSIASVPIPSNMGPGNISMVLDGANRPHVAYMNFANGGDRSLRYLYFNGSQWINGGVNQGIVGTNLWTPTIGFTTTYLALDNAGVPHLAYSLPSDTINAYGPMKYATLQGGASGTWVSESLGQLGADPTLAIGSDNMPRMVFNGDAGIVYAFKAGGVWQFETIVAGQWASSPTMTLSDANVPFVSFGMTANEDMYVAKREAAGWAVTKIDGDGTSGPHVILGRYGTGIDVDETGAAHVSYQAIDIYGPTFHADLMYGGSIQPPPCVVITGSPASDSPCAGGNTSFTVVATGNGPLTYEWRKSGTPLSDGPTGSGSVIGGATTPLLSISNVSVADEGGYDCVVSESCGSATSGTAFLTLGTGITITSPPASMTTCPAGNAWFSVAVSGAGAYAYQWQRDGVPLINGPTGSGSVIAGATTNTVWIYGAMAADVGFYDCVIVGDCGGVTSPAAELTLGTSATITLQPEPKTATVGGFAEFTVVAGGSGPLYYEWHKDGLPLINGRTPQGSLIVGSHSPTLTILDIAQEDAGQYECEISDDCGDVTSDSALLTVIAGCDPCDVNCDGTLNPFDIQPFVVVLSGGGSCAPCAGDTNNNGTVNPFDIQSFIDCLSR